MGGKASAASKNKYTAKAYDRIGLVVPKGRKEEITAHAKEIGETVNGYVNNLIRDDMGISESEWGMDMEMKTLAHLRQVLAEHNYSLRKKHRGLDTGYLIMDNGIGMAVAGSMSGEYAPGLTLEEVQEWIDAQEW